MEWNKYIKRIIFFFIGVIFVHFITGMIMSTSFPEIMESIVEKEAQNFIKNLEKEVFSALIKLYLISYLLFGLLPDKIKKSKWYWRGISFIVFYLLCVLIYLWI